MPSTTDFEDDSLEALMGNVEDDDADAPEDEDDEGEEE
jgi:hypothetical protein